MCFISPQNMKRKLENKKKKSNSMNSVTKLCFTTEILFCHYFFVALLKNK